MDFSISNVKLYQEMLNYQIQGLRFLSDAGFTIGYYITSKFENVFGDHNQKSEINSTDYLRDLVGFIEVKLEPWHCNFYF